MKPIYSTEQLKEILSTLAIGSEASDMIVNFAEMQDSQLRYSRYRCDVAARMLGHDQINEMIDDDY